MEQKKVFRPPAYMTPEQITTIKAEIADIKAMINSSDETRNSSIGYFKHATSHLDIDEVKKSISAREKQLKKLTPQKFTGERANKALADAKKLKGWIETNIPKETFVRYPNEKDPVSKASDFERAIQSQVKWQQHGQKVIETYHYLMRRIDPDAPREDFNRLVRERP